MTTAPMGELGPRRDMHAPKGHHAYLPCVCARQGALSITVTFWSPLCPLTSDACLLCMSCNRRPPTGLLMRWGPENNKFCVKGIHLAGMLYAYHSYLGVQCSSLLVCFVHISYVGVQARCVCFGVEVHADLCA